MSKKLSLFQAIFEQIRINRKKSRPTTFLRETIDDSNVEWNNIENTMRNTGNLILEELTIAYYSYFQKGLKHPNFHFLNQNGVNGCAINCYKYDLSFTEWRHVQVHCLQQAIDQKYIVHLRRQISKTENQQLITTFKYYLKPSIKLMTEIPSEQLYGNITLELILQNTKPFRFLLSANYYSDRNYKKEKNFKYFLESLNKM